MPVKNYRFSSGCLQLKNFELTTNKSRFRIHKVENTILFFEDKTSSKTENFKVYLF